MEIAGTGGMILSYLGVDVGTSSIKVGLLEDDGSWIVKSAPVAGADESLRTGLMDPEQWWAATVDALQILGRERSLNDVQAVAAIGNTPTLILVGERGVPVYPALLWSDTRASEEAQILSGQRESSQWENIYGGFIPISAAYPSAKLLWLLRHEPGVVSRARQILQPKDFINYRLTRVMASDHWSAKGIVSIGRDKDTRPLEVLGLDPSLAPHCFRPIDVIGAITGEVSDKTGLARGIPVMAGWSDTLGAVLSMGLSEEEGFILSGTSESIGVITRQAPLETHATLCAPVWDSGLYIVYGPTSTGMSTIRWADSLCKGVVETPTDLPFETKGPIFVPFIMGQRSPLWNDEVRGAWFNVDIHTRPGQLYDAVVEGVAASERDVLDAVQHLMGIRCRRIVVAGGGSGLERLNQWRSAIFELPLTEVAGEPVLGASLLAYWGKHPHEFPARMAERPTRRVLPLSPSAQGRYQTYLQARAAVIAYTEEVKGAFPYA